MQPTIQIQQIALSHHPPYFPPPARTTGSYKDGQVLYWTGHSISDIIDTLRGKRLPSSFQGILGVDMARYLVKTGQFDELRELFGFRGDDRSLENQVRHQYECMTRIFQAEKNFPLGKGIDPSILNAIGLGGGNQKIVWLQRLAVKYISYRRERMAPRSMVVGFVMSKSPPTVEQGDIYLGLDGLVSRDMLKMSNPFPMRDPTYLIPRRYMR